MRSTDSVARRASASQVGGGPELLVEGLDVFYGQAHALQDVNLSLGQGVLAVVGRNGMGKTTLCKAITGLVPASGSVRFGGQQILGRTPDQITRLGVAYVPQGRRVWRSLTVDETLRLAARTARQGAWTVERVYQVFPRLAERKDNGGAQLSGGEQQMLAIGRALLFNPQLLVMDEPTEGLAPVIVEQVATLLKALADERSMSVLLIEQNLGVALEVADDVAIMVNGRIAHCLPASQLAADRALQQRLLGLKAGAAAETESGSTPEEAGAAAPTAGPVWRVVRAVDASGPSTWAAPAPDRAWHPEPSEEVEAQTAADRSSGGAVPAASIASAEPQPHDRAVYLAGAWGEQQRELAYVRRCLEQLGARVVSVDISESGFSSAQVGASELLRYQPHALRPVQASSSDALAAAFPAFLQSRRDLGALLILTRQGTAAVACAGAVALPAGVPKVLVTAEPLPGTDADVLVMTAPIGELNRVSETLLAHAASATVGMLRESPALHRAAKPLVCVTGSGLVDGTVRHVRRCLGEAYDVLVLDMAAYGATTLDRIVRAGLVAAVVDIAPLDVSGGVVLAQDDAARARFKAIGSQGVPYLLVPSLLEVAAFPAGKAVPGRLLQREVLASATAGSVVAVSRDEARQVADWLAQALAGFEGPVHLVLPAPSADAMQKLGGGVNSLELQGLVHRGLTRQLKPSRSLQISELPHTLHSVRLGEFVGQATRDLLQARAGH